MAPEFVDRPGGSRWQSALPTRRQQVGLGTIVFIVPRRIREVQFMLPEFVDRTGGSKWNRALPGGSKWVWAQSCLPSYEEFGKSNLCFPNSSIEPAAASGSRPCRPGGSGWVQAQSARVMRKTASPSGLTSSKSIW